jgi:hypothetical protein
MLLSATGSAAMQGITHKQHTKRTIHNKIIVTVHIPPENLQKGNDLAVI